jgi:hypothetical protein
LSVFGVEWEVPSKPSARGEGSGPNMAVLIVNPNINQLFNEHDSVTLVVKILTKNQITQVNIYGD